MQSTCALSFVFFSTFTCQLLEIEYEFLMTKLQQTCGRKGFLKTKMYETRVSE